MVAPRQIGLASGFKEAVLRLQAADRDDHAGVGNRRPIGCDRSRCVNARGLILAM